MTSGNRLSGTGSGPTGDSSGNGTASRESGSQDQASEDGDQSATKTSKEAESGSKSPPLEVALTAAIEGTQTRVANFQSYWEDQRMAGYFMLYSVLVTILLAGLAVSTDDIQIMINVLVVYGFSSIPFFVWLGEAVEDDDGEDSMLP